MFFQNQPQSSSTPSLDDVKIGLQYDAVLKEIEKTVTSLATPLGIVTSKFQELTLNAESLNKAFTGTRQRIQELMLATTAAAPGIVRLGGEYQKAAETIYDIAEGSRRLVVAQTKDIEQLFAAGEIIGVNVKSIVSNFADVGYSYDKIANRLEESIVYVQGIGLNARKVMQDVVNNTKELSRFNFNEGVLGLTKMAAQASRLRFDMKDTFTLAERVMNPDEAVKIAAAFQRLGVVTSNLTNPFELMNQSITDPSGLQTSLINVAKSFTYFDEKTKSFRINPQGILTLQAIADETQVSAENLRRSALAAAEMDDKLKRISTAGLSFNVSEEDKMMLANVARMGEKGEYEVSLRDERGNEYQRKLYELNEKDFQRLIKQQREAPKTLEEIQKKQLTTAESLLYEMRGVKELLTSTYTQLPGVIRGIDQGLTATREVAASFSKTYSQSGVFRTLESYKDRLREIEETTPNAEERDKLQAEVLTDIKNYLKSSSGTIYQNFVNQIQKSVSDKGSLALEFLNSILPNQLEMERKKLEAGKNLGTKEPQPTVQGQKTNYSILGQPIVATNTTPLTTLVANTTTPQTLNVQVGFQKGNPIPIEFTAAADPKFDYDKFNNMLKTAPQSTKEQLATTIMTNVEQRMLELIKQGYFLPKK